MYPAVTMIAMIEDKCVMGNRLLLKHLISYEKIYVVQPLYCT